MFTLEQNMQATELRENLEVLIRQRKAKEPQLRTKTKNNELLVPSDTLKDVYGNNLLDYAIIEGDLSEVKRLIDSGFSSTNALKYTILGAHDDIAELL